MSEVRAIGGKYANADGYDAYMGGWSTRLALPFLGFAAVSDGGTIVDIGCGTGNLLAVAASKFPSATLIGIDPSPALLGKARERPELAQASLVQGSVERLPLADGSADNTLSLLVLQEFTDRSAALTEMRRVTRSGGTVAGCQWDFARMPVIDALVGAIESVRPAAAQSIAANSPRAFVNEAELVACWTEAGLGTIRFDRLSVSRTFGSFEELWRPLLVGSTPSTLTLAAMTPDEQDAVRAMMAKGLSDGAEGPVTLIAEAFAISGRSPQVQRRSQEAR